MIVLQTLSEFKKSLQYTANFLLYREKLAIRKRVGPDWLILSLMTREQICFGFTPKSTQNSLQKVFKIDYILAKREKCICIGGTLPWNMAYCARNGEMALFQLQQFCFTVYISLLCTTDSVRITNLSSTCWNQNPKNRLFTESRKARFKQQKIRRNSIKKGLSYRQSFCIPIVFAIYQAAAAFRFFFAERTHMTMPRTVSRKHTPAAV